MAVSAAMAVCLSLAVLLSWGADALVAVARNETRLRSMAYEAAVPEDVGYFRGIFKALQNEEMGTARRFSTYWNSGSIKVALGIFTEVSSDRHREIRQVLRDTWMQHPDVCPLLTANSTCSIRTVFVAGSRGQKILHYDMVEDPDMLLLNIKEAKNQGKTYYWLKWAANHYKWADYIGKIEDDVYLHAKTFLDNLPKAMDWNTNAKPECEGYYGKPWTCLREVCPPTSCGPPVGGLLTSFRNKRYKDDCWTYMQGGFYVLSRHLAAAISKDGGWLDKHKVGPEDLRTGQAVDQWARYEFGKKPQEPDFSPRCVRTWTDYNLVANDHMYYHARGQNDRPRGVSRDWDSFYDV